MALIVVGAATLPAPAFVAGIGAAAIVIGIAIVDTRGARTEASASAAP